MNSAFASAVSQNLTGAKAGFILSHPLFTLATKKVARWVLALANSPKRSSRAHKDCSTVAAALQQRNIFCAVFFFA